MVRECIVSFKRVAPCTKRSWSMARSTKYQGIRGVVLFGGRVSATTSSVGSTYRLALARVSKQGGLRISSRRRIANGLGGRNMARRSAVLTVILFRSDENEDQSQDDGGHAVPQSVFHRLSAPVAFGFH